LQGCRREKTEKSAGTARIKKILLLAPGGNLIIEVRVVDKKAKILKENKMGLAAGNVKRTEKLSKTTPRNSGKKTMPPKKKGFFWKRK